MSTILTDDGVLLRSAAIWTIFEDFIYWLMAL